jgi:hypothetical protein
MMNLFVQFEHAYFHWPGIQEHPLRQKAAIVHGELIVF